MTNAASGYCWNGSHRVPLNLLWCTKSIRASRSGNGKPLPAITTELLLACAYRIGVRNGKIAENPIPKMASNNRIRFFDADERPSCAKIRELSSDREAEFDLASHSGMRRNEQYRTRWVQVDFRLGPVHVVDSKNGERRSVLMNGARAWSWKIAAARCIGLRRASYERRAGTRLAALIRGSYPQIQFG